jgi:periplasmic divalent cation tolerance protein
MGAVIVLTTLPAAADAAAFARTLVDERLAACVNVLPVMQSVYQWKDALQQDDERQLVIKTWRDRLPPLEARLKRLHPYEVPEFLVLEAGGGAPAYLEWLQAETRQR